MLISEAISRQPVSVSVPWRDISGVAKRLVWQITLFEQNNLMFSFDISLLRGENWMRYAGGDQARLGVSIKGILAVLELDLAPVLSIVQRIFLLTVMNAFT